MNKTLTLNPSIGHPFAIGWRINQQILWFLGFIIVASLLFFYIFQVNEMTKASATISNYERNINELSQENRISEISFFQANSLANLEILLEDLKYEKVGQIRYIQVLENQIAVK